MRQAPPGPLPRDLPIALGASYWWDPSTDAAVDGSQRLVSWTDRIASAVIVPEAVGYILDPAGIGGQPAWACVPGERGVFVGLPGAFVNASYFVYAVYNPAADGVGSVLGVRDIPPAAGVGFISPVGAGASEQMTTVELADANAGSSVLNLPRLPAGVPQWGAAGYNAAALLLTQQTLRATATGPAAPRPITATTLIAPLSFLYGGFLSHLVVFSFFPSASQRSQMARWCQERVVFG